MLHFDRRGAGAPLVLLHGIGSRRQMWGTVLDALAARHDVISVDLPGFGGSAPLAGQTDITALTDAVAELARQLSLEHWHVAGNSTGGGVALELAQRGTVASATALSPIGFWSSRERRFAQVTLGQARRGARRLRAAGLVPKLNATAVGRTVLFGQLLGRPWRFTDGPASIDGLIDCPGWDDVMASFTGYVAPRDHGDVPVTVAWGTRDHLLLPRQARRARAVLPHAHHTWLPGCGHVPCSDDPVLVAATLLAGAARAGGGPGGGR